MFVIHIQSLPTVKLLSETTLCLRMMNMGMEGFYAINSLFDISRTQIKYKISTVSLRRTPLCVFELLLQFVLAPMPLRQTPVHLSHIVENVM